MDERIGKLEEFHSKRCYERYMYAVKFGREINMYIDKGFLVFDENKEHVKGRFVFYGFSSPTIGIIEGNCTIGHFAATYDDDGKVWMTNEDNEAKKDIKKYFGSFSIVNPRDIKKITF